MALALLAAGTSWLFMQAAQRVAEQLHPEGIKHVPDPTWISALFAALALAPYFVSFLLLSTRRAGSILAGGGIAGGLFGLFLILTPGIGMGLVTAFGLSQAPFFFQTAISLLGFLASSVWVVIAAVWIGKANWLVFTVAAGATLVTVILGNGWVEKTRYELHREDEVQKQANAFYRTRPRPVGARQTLTYLASCLLQNHAAHPEFPYPTGIDPNTWWPCDIKFEPTTVPDFKLSYTPQRDSASGKVVDFQLVAIPKARGISNQNPLMIDRRGIVFVMDPWAKNVPAKIVATPSDGESSQIGVLKGNIERYMKEKNGGVAPAVLTAEIIGGFSHETPAIDQNGTYLTTRNFSYVYLAPKPGVPNQFGIIAQCQSYAENCLRSYFLDYDGVIHATAEPRQPEKKDPPALDCEMVAGECPGNARMSDGTVE